ncbi:MAG TPA: hypothetical protein VHE30_18725 [Polyangiaceae bacterium]|nr:hypothetical protein [Polyangiaceae bacterium]
MTDETRLLRGAGTDVERALLESAREDAPSADARAKTLVALGLAVSAGTALAPAAVHAATGIGGASKAGGSVTALLVAKWLGTGAAVGAVTAACIATATTPGLFSEKAAPAAASAAPSIAARPAPAVVRERREEAEPVAPAATAPEAPLATPEARATRATETETAERAPDPATSPGGPAASNVVAEVASLDRARAALAAGDARTALARLSEHARRFPGGALEPEAVVLRVRALRETGDVTGATALAKSFLAAHPDSSQAARLRALVGLGTR